jgi:hypothetical protein
MRSILDREGQEAAILGRTFRLVMRSNRDRESQKAAMPGRTFNRLCDRTVIAKAKKRPSVAALSK